MPRIVHTAKPKEITSEYPSDTGRFLSVENDNNETLKVAFFGDSTLDNGYWVQTDRRYKEKTGTVIYQVAKNLAEASELSHSYRLAQLAVDGATTHDIDRIKALNFILPRDANWQKGDEDHGDDPVNQRQAVKQYQPDVAVLSVGGNNYRTALQGVLLEKMNYFQLLFRYTPHKARLSLKKTFDSVKKELVEEYKQILDNLYNDNPNLKRLVLSSQYFPALTDFTIYMIYTGFSHVARAQGKGQTPFQAMEETMNELYREVGEYAAEKFKDKEIVFADMTSSMNPLEGNHSHQIEPNEHGAYVMGKVLSQAVSVDFAKKGLSSAMAKVSLDDKKQIHVQAMIKEDVKAYEVSKIASLISGHRYAHVGRFFAKGASYSTRMTSAYHMILGKQFDTEYTGLFAFGLLDTAIVPVMAHYMWRLAVKETLPLGLRVPIGAIVAPVIAAKWALGLAFLAVLALPIYGFHKAITPKKDVVKTERLIQDDMMKEDGLGANNSMLVAAT